MFHSKQSENKDQVIGKSTLFILLLAAVILWALSWGLIQFYLDDSGVRGQFGDQFGAVNALFSGLAFAGLIYTIHLQRIEIRQTQKEIKNQTEEFKAQNETLALQRFEHSFFNMLSQHNEMVGKLQIAEHLGKNSMKAILRGSLASSFSLNSLIDTMTNSKADCEESISWVVNDFYEGIYRHYYSFFGVYFRSLYRIFVYIDSSTIENKELYADIVRSQLSDDEIVMIFINGLSNRGKKFKMYIEKYALLNNLSSDKVTPDMKKLYSSAAYGE